MLRRSPERPRDIERIALPGGMADLARSEIRFDDGGRAELSEKEVELLRYLAANSGRAISRDELLLRVWQISPRGLATRTIDMHVTRLREKLRDDPAEPHVVLTVRGKGYMLAMAAGAEAKGAATTTTAPRALPRFGYTAESVKAESSCDLLGTSGWRLPSVWP